MTIKNENATGTELLYSVLAGNEFVRMAMSLNI